MRNRVLLGALAVLAVLAGAVLAFSGGDDQPVAAPTTTVAPSTTTTTEAPVPADPWEVEVAYSLVNQLEVFRERPADEPAGYGTTTTAPPPASAPGPDGVIQVEVTADQQAKLAAEILLRDDAAALSLIDADTPPLETSPLPQA